MTDFFGSLDNAADYHDARGNSDWVGEGETDETRTAALIRATQALDGTYGWRYPGTKTGGRSQTLLWPRTNAYDNAGDLIPSDEVPVEIENATYEMALVELVTPGSLSPSVTAGKIKTRVRVEGAVDVTYKDGGISSQRPTLTVVDDILSSILTRFGGSVDVLRV